MQFLYITVPMLKNTTIFVLITTTIYAFQALHSGTDHRQQRRFGTNRLIPHDGHADGPEGFRNGKIGYASAISVVFFLIVLSISLLQRILLKEEGRAMTTQSQPSQARRERFGKIAQYSLHALLVMFFLLPLLFMFVSALKGDELQLLKDMGSLKAFVPYGSTSLQNFTDVFQGTNFKNAFVNSIFMVSLTVVLGILVNSMLAYALARFKFAGRNLLLSVIVSLIIIPFEAIAVPAADAGQSDALVHRRCRLAGFLPRADHPFHRPRLLHLPFYQFFIELPKDLEEAALMDGANRLRILLEHRNAAVQAGHRDGGGAAVPLALG